MKKFFALDRKNPNGQVEWAEWLADFEKRFDPEEKTTRLYKAREHSHTTIMKWESLSGTESIFWGQIACPFICTSF